jgi:hypothetical protein
MSSVGTGPFTIAPGESITVGFAFLGGDDLPDLQHNVDLARSAWNGDPAPTTAVLSPPLGNPVLNGDARWTLVVPDVPARLRACIYNVRGQLVRDLSDARLFPGTNVLLWDRQDDRGERAAPGVYFLHVDLGTQVRRSKVVLLE